MHSFENIEQVKSKIFNMAIMMLNLKNLALELFHFQMENNPIYAPYAALIIKREKPQIISLKFLFFP